MAATDWTANRQAHVVCPADQVFGLVKHPGEPDVALAPTSAGHGVDGLAAPGLLFLLADSVIGRTCVRVVGPDEVVVTSSLHLEVHAQPFTADVRGGRGMAYRYHGGAAGTAVLTSGDAVVASASGRFAVLPTGTRAAGTVAERQVAPPAASTARAVLDAPVFTTLGARLLEQRPDTVTLSFVAGPELANERQGLHGGCGALMGERAVDVLLRAVAPADVDVRPVTLSAAFVRPVPADGSAVRCTARLEHRGRRMLAAQAVLETPDGKPAVVVDVVAAGVAR